MLVYCYCFLYVNVSFPMTTRSCNSRTPEEYLVGYQTSQRNWVTIKVHYRYLRKCLLGWHGSRLGFVTPYDGEVSLGPLGNASSLWAQSDQVSGHGIMHYGTSKVTWRQRDWTRYWDTDDRISGSNIPSDKGNSIRGCLNPRHHGSSDEIIEEYVGANMGIQIPLLVIDRRAVSVMSAFLLNP